MSQKILKTAVAIIFVVVFGYIFRTSIGQTYSDLYNKYFPCTKPITYSIGSFDSRFGISKEDFMKAVVDAENIWEKPIGKKLFEYKTDGKLKINLVYDSRQAGTIKLQSLNETANVDQASYNSLKTQYINLKAQYLSQKSAYDSAVAYFSTQQSAYNAEVGKWNSQGGAPKQVYDQLSAERADLARQFEALKTLETKNNVLVDEINSLVADLNDQARKLNLNVDQINKIGQTMGEEFTEGLYKTNENSSEIDVYQYENRQKLVRVLAHEFGHALGLNHSDGKKDIMYMLNDGFNDTLTANDISAIKKRCNIK